MRKTLFLLLLAIVMPTVATADAGRAVYNLGEGTHDWGTGDSRNETYNVALRIADEAFVGCRVTGVRIWFTTVEGLSATRAWLSKELTVKSTKFAGPDVETVDFDAVDGYNEVSFSRPYTITSEGIYVGYSVLAAKDVNMAPIRLTESGSADGLFVHTSGLYRGHFYTFDGEKGALAIEVMLEGDVLQDAERTHRRAVDAAEKRRDDENRRDNREVKRKERGEELHLRRPGEVRRRVEAERLRNDRREERRVHREEARYRGRDAEVFRKASHVRPLRIASTIALILRNSSLTLMCCGHFGWHLSQEVQCEASAFAPTLLR